MELAIVWPLGKPHAQPRIKFLEASELGLGTPGRL